MTSLILKSESHFRGLGPALGTRDGRKFVILAVQETQAVWVSEGGDEKTYNVSATWHSYF